MRSSHRYFVYCISLFRCDITGSRIAPQPTFARQNVRHMVTDVGIAIAIITWRVYVAVGTNLNARVPLLITMKMLCLIPYVLFMYQHNSRMKLLTYLGMNVMSLITLLIRVDHTVSVPSPLTTMFMTNSLIHASGRVQNLNHLLM